MQRPAPECEALQGAWLALKLQLHRGPVDQRPTFYARRNPKEIRDSTCSTDRVSGSGLAAIHRLRLSVCPEGNLRSQNLHLLRLERAVRTIA